MLYNLLKNLIDNNYYEKQDMINKLNVFLLYNQISETQYKELFNKIGGENGNIQERKAY